MLRSLTLASLLLFPLPAIAEQPLALVRDLEQPLTAPKPQSEPVSEYQTHTDESTADTRMTKIKLISESSLGLTLEIGLDENQNPDSVGIEIRRSRKRLEFFP